MADGFLNFMDMIDGGGMGASGSEFQGGGLLSDIGNALFQPAGYREQQRAMAETRPQMRPMAMEPVQPRPMPTRPQARPDMAPTASGMTPANAYVAPQQYSTSGMNPANAYMPNLTFEQFVAGLGPSAMSASPQALRQAYEQHIMGY